MCVYGCTCWVGVVTVGGVSVRLDWRSAGTYLDTGEAEGSRGPDAVFPIGRGDPPVLKKCFDKCVQE